MSERPSPQVTAGTSRGWRIPGKHDLAVEGRNIGRVVVSTFTDNLPYDWVCVTVSDVTGLDDSYFDGHTEAELDAISGERRNALGGPNLDQTVLAFQLNDGPTVPAASTTLNPVKFLDHADWTTDTNPEPADGPALICRHATVTLRHQDGLVIVRARTEQPANVAWSVNCGTPGILPQPGPAHPRIRFIQERNLPLDEIGRRVLAEQVKENPPTIGCLTISNAQQWRLQYGRAIALADAGKTPGVESLRAE